MDPTLWITKYEDHCVGPICICVDATSRQRLHYGTIKVALITRVALLRLHPGVIKVFVYRAGNTESRLQPHHLLCRAAHR